jgi:hypothetical protein
VGRRNETGREDGRVLTLRLTPALVAPASVVGTGVVRGRFGGGGRPAEDSAVGTAGVPPDTNGDPAAETKDGAQTGKELLELPGTGTARCIEAGPDGEASVDVVALIPVNFDC